MCQEPEYAEAIVDRDDDDTLLGQTFAVVEEDFAGYSVKKAAERSPNSFVARSVNSASVLTP